MVEFTHVVQGRAGLHARPVAEICSFAGSYDGKITLAFSGQTVSATDIMATLFYSGLFGMDPTDPDNPERDRFILSKGHAAPALYALFVQLGYLPHDEITTLRQVGSRLQGHPDRHACPGVEVCTGSLGQGLSVGAGMALGLRLDAERDGEDPRRVFVLLGDGEMQEGENWEAAMFAGNQALDNLVAIVDLNNLQIDGHVTDVNNIEPVADKFRAFGWEAIAADGHDIASVRAALEAAVAVSGKPAVIVAKTIKGKGVSFMEDQVSWHGNAPSPEQTATALAEIDAAYEALLAAQKEA